MNEDQLNDCAKRLRECREENHYTLEEIGKKIGVHKSTILRWENGETGKIKNAILKVLAELYDVNVVWLMGYDIPKKSISVKPTRTVKVPILGYIRAGIPIEAITDVLGDYSITEEKAKKGKFFALKVKGNSMFPLILENDIILFKQQNTCENGQICAVLVNRR